jgi:hypothetical protein|tara:strand:+ start:99 stop:515 length:417 start_codon:yes stop_codon:yes gene_type:complete
MATLAKINVVTSSADSTTNLHSYVNLSLVESTLSTATTLVARYTIDGVTAKTITFTVTGGTPIAADMAKDTLITANAAGEKLKNVDRLSNWLMSAVRDSKNSRSHAKFYDWNHANITAQAGLTFGGAATAPLVSIVFS